MNDGSSFGGTNFRIEKIMFKKSSPYTVELSGFLWQSKMLSYLKGYSLEIEYPKVLSDAQLEFVEQKLIEYFSGDKKSLEKIKEIRKKCPIVIYIPPKLFS